MQVKINKKARSAISAYAIQNGIAPRDVVFAIVKLTAENDLFDAVLDDYFSAAGAASKKTIMLTRRQFDLYEYLLKNDGKPLDHDAAAIEAKTTAVNVRRVVKTLAYNGVIRYSGNEYEIVRVPPMTIVSPDGQIVSFPKDASK